MIIKCEIASVMLTDDDGYLERGVRAKCTRCGHVEKVIGTSAGCAVRCLMVMRQKCPGGARHFYIKDDGVPDDRERYERRYRGDPACCFMAEGLELHLRIKAAYLRFAAEREAGQ